MACACYAEDTPETSPSFPLIENPIHKCCHTAFVTSISLVLLVFFVNVIGLRSLLH